MGKTKPVIYQVYPSLPRNDRYPLQEFKLRVIKYDNSEVLFDLREFVTSTLLMGYSRKGVSLTLNQVKDLYSHLLDVIKTMEEVEDAIITKESDAAKAIISKETPTT